MKREIHTAPLVAGVTFLLLGAILVLDALDVFEVAAGVLAAMLLIAAGLAVLAGQLRRGGPASDDR